MSRFGKRKVEWTDEALDSLLDQVTAMGDAIEALESSIEELRSEDREMSGEQTELARLLLGVLRDHRDSAPLASSLPSVDG